VNAASTNDHDQTMAGVNTQILVLYGSNQPGNPAAGLKNIKDFLMDDFNSAGFMPTSSYMQQVYVSSSGTGEPSVGKPDGLSLVQVR
jgi:hypothetical protein